MHWNCWLESLTRVRYQKQKIHFLINLQKKITTIPVVELLSWSKMKWLIKVNFLGINRLRKFLISPTLVNGCQTDSDIQWQIWGRKTCSHGDTKLVFTPKLSTKTQIYRHTPTTIWQSLRQKIITVNEVVNKVTTTGQCWANVLYKLNRSDPKAAYSAENCNQ